MKKYAVLLALCAGMAHAAFKDGNKLYSQMTSGVNSDWFNAIGYVTGIADAASGETSCPPPNVTAGQVYDAVKQHLEDRPTLRHYEAAVIVNYVLSKAWPCKKGNGT
jgi:hypothetical protein